MEAMDPLPRPSRIEEGTSHEGTSHEGAAQVVVVVVVVVVAVVMVVVGLEFGLVIVVVVGVVRVCGGGGSAFRETTIVATGQIAGLMGWRDDGLKLQTDFDFVVIEFSLFEFPCHPFPVLVVVVSNNGVSCTLTVAAIAADRGLPWWLPFSVVPELPFHGLVVAVFSYVCVS
jgi:hypothetical protein